MNQSILPPWTKFDWKFFGNDMSTSDINLMLPWVLTRNIIHVYSGKTVLHVYLKQVHYFQAKIQRMVHAMFVVLQ